MSGVGHPAPSRRSRRGLPMRTSLALGFGSVLLFTAGGILFNSHYTSRKIVGDLSVAVLEQSRDLADLKLDGFFGVVSRINTRVAVRFQDGQLAWNDWEMLRRLILPILQQVPQASGVGTGDEEGNAYNLTRFGASWRSQEVRPGLWGSNTLWKEWTSHGEFVREWWETSGYDPRERPWFRGALEQGPLGAQNRLDHLPHWTAPYTFYTTGRYGITVATQVALTNDQRGVVYFDVDIGDLDAFVVGSRPSEHGFLLVLNDDLKVLGWPGEDALSRERVLTGDQHVEMARERLPLLTESLDRWDRLGRPDDVMERIRPHGLDLWIALRSLAVAGEKFHLLVAIPEDDFLGEARRERQRMAVLLVLSLLGGLALAAWLAGRYTRPISALVRRNEAIQRLDLSEQQEVPSRVREVQQLSSAQARMAAALESFSRYVPRELIAELLRRGEAARIGAHPAELTVLFSDIRGFTALTETLSPDDVARALSDYFDLLHTVVARHQGTTDKFIGDAIMAFWGAPRPDASHALNAVRAVLEARERLDTLNARWRSEGRTEFQTSFGLATGPVVVGNVGARTRLNYTVLGNTVNVASRCVGLGRELGCDVLALESVAQATAGAVEWRRLGPVQVRGIREPRMVCEPIGLCGRVPASRLEFRDRYERALEAYLRKEFAAAQTVLNPLAGERPDDRSVHYLLTRCRELGRTPARDLRTERLSFG